MARFTDAKGKTWVLRVTVSTVRRVKDNLDEDLSRAVETNFLQRIGENAVLLGEILWCMLAPQAAEAGVSEEEFFDALEGDALDAAANAFMDALVDFFPNPRREMLKKLMAAGKKAQESAVKEASLTLDAEIAKILSGK